jgi:hypothetical protein
MLTNDGRRRRVVAVLTLGAGFLIYNGVVSESQVILRETRTKQGKKTSDEAERREKETQTLTFSSVQNVKS